MGCTTAFKSIIGNIDATKYSAARNTSVRTTHVHSRFLASAHVNIFLFRDGSKHAINWNSTHREKHARTANSAHNARMWQCLSTKIENWILKARMKTPRDEKWLIKQITQRVGQRMHQRDGDRQISNVNSYRQCFESKSGPKKGVGKWEQRRRERSN